MILPKYIDGFSIPYLYDGETMALLELDAKEDLSLIKELQLIDNNGETLSHNSIAFLSESIKELPRNTYANQIEKTNILPLSVVLPITSSCNLNCPYCFAQTKDGDFTFKNYTEADIEKLIQRLYAINKGATTLLIFFGGEPLLNFKLIKHAVSYINRNGLKDSFCYSITTNGTLVTREIAEFLKDHQFAILLSMDGYENEFNYRKFRNGKPSVSKVLKNIDLLRGYDVTFEIRATITSDNPYIYETYHFFEELKIPYTLAFAYPSDNTRNQELTTYSYENILRVKKSMSKLLMDYREKIENGEKIYNSVLLSLCSFFEYRTIRERICSGGINYYTILADGSLFKCAHLMNNQQDIIGNIFDDNIHFDEGFAIAPAINELEEKCQKCWTKHICSGGCPSQKLSLSRLPNQPLPDVNCEIEKVLSEFYLQAYILLKQHPK